MSCDVILQLYLYLHDKPDARRSKAPPVTPTVENDCMLITILNYLPLNFFSLVSHLSASERKKVQRKQRKALARAQAKAELEKEKGQLSNNDVM